MKRVIMALVAAFTICSAVSAQYKVSVKNVDSLEAIKVKTLIEYTNKQVERYNLEQKQAARLLNLNTLYYEKLPFLRRNGRMGNRGPAASEGFRRGNVDMKERPSKEQMEKRNQEAKENQEAYNKQVKEILTPEQYKMYEKDAKTMQSRRRGFGGHGPQMRGNGPQFPTPKEVED